MANDYPGTGEVSDPATKMWLIAPHDTTPVDPIPKALRFDAAGVVKLRAIDSSADATINVAAGEVLPVRVKLIYDTGSDSIVIHGLG